jgi:hypothetical protein
MNFHLINGDCLESLKQVEDESVDSLVTDPPAGISFMGKEWDDDKGGRKQWVAWMTEVMTECLRVMKPGAHGLVWALPRTSHWTATALEDAGFEVRDVVTHLFGTGFPKSMDISKALDKAAGAQREVVGMRESPYTSTSRNDSQSIGKHKVEVGVNGYEMHPITAPATEAAKQWAGWGTALKPASEHWILVRKPLEAKHTVAANVLKHGVGGINIDACRVGSQERPKMIRTQTIVAASSMSGTSTGATNSGETTCQGRFPANLILDEEAAAALDEQSGTLTSGKPGIRRKEHETTSMSGRLGLTGMKESGFGDSGGASRFFYVAKASKSDKGAENTHPTVKSRALMSYLIKLVTPPGGVVLDPFMGSGSTGVAALADSFLFIGIEKETNYYSIAQARIANSAVAEVV